MILLHKSLHYSTDLTMINLLTVRAVKFLILCWPFKSDLFKKRQLEKSNLQLWHSYWSGLCCSPFEKAVELTVIIHVGMPYSFTCRCANWMFSDKSSETLSKHCYKISVCLFIIPYSILTSHHEYETSLQWSNDFSLQIKVFATSENICCREHALF